MGSTAVAVLTLLRLAQTCAAMLSTAVRIWDKVYTLGAKSCTCAKSAVSSRSLIVTSPLGFVSVKSWACIFVETGGCQTNHWPSGAWQTPPMLFPEASVAPSHVRGNGSSSRRCVIWDASSWTSWRQVLSSSWTLGKSWNCLPRACCSVCCTHVNIPLNLATAGVILRRRHTRCRHVWRETWCTTVGFESKVTCTLLLCLGVSRRW